MSWLWCFTCSALYLYCTCCFVCTCSSVCVCVCVCVHVCVCEYVSEQLIPIEGHRIRLVLCAHVPLGLCVYFRAIHSRSRTPYLTTVLCVHVPLCLCVCFRAIHSQSGTPYLTTVLCVHVPLCLCVCFRAIHSQSGTPYLTTVLCVPVPLCLCFRATHSQSGTPYSTTVSRRRPVDIGSPGWIRWQSKMLQLVLAPRWVTIRLTSCGLQMCPCNSMLIVPAKKERELQKQKPVSVTVAQFD